MAPVGQPLHAFDFNFLEEGRIVVRRAQEGESFVTLDCVNRNLDREMLMICDGVKPVAIAGVMGGMNSEIREDTKTVLLESTYFEPMGNRKTSLKLGLETEAAYRFGRGVDYEGTLYAANRAAQLIQELGHTPVRQRVAGPEKGREAGIRPRVDGVGKEVQRRLGPHVPLTESQADLLCA